mgnify:CR=1 FL=1
MGALVLVKKLMFIFRKEDVKSLVRVKWFQKKNLILNMLLKFSRRVYWFSKIEQGTLKENSDLEKAIVKETQERWLKCGPRKKSETWREFVLVVRLELHGHISWRIT